LEFGKRLKQAREKKGVKQLALASKLGLTRTSISNIERGEQRIFLDLAYEAADFLGIEVASLIPSLSEVVVTPRIHSVADSPLDPDIEKEAARVVMHVQAKNFRKKGREFIGESIKRS
jgi:transcriptional regulator with XRE-family HTH domain